MSVESLGETLHEIAEREKEKQSQFEQHIYVCMGTACMSSHSEQIKTNIQTALESHQLAHKCSVSSGGCRGLCANGPMVSVEPEGTLYQAVKPDDATQIVESLETGKPVERLKVDLTEPFYANQKRVVLARAGKLDPERLEDYLAKDGYQALIKALEMEPHEIIDEISRSGLRGRGGGGYSTALKWSTVAKARNDRKYIICNGDEGDPGAFMDRSVMEDYPHAVLEGMIIAGFAVGAEQGYLYVRAEYPLAVKRLQAAVKQAQKNNLLGNNILGTPFNFNIDVRLGAGAFVCGEETALMASIEGKRGTPRPRPPYPAESGLWGCPTLINNVETFANVAPIIRNDAEWYAHIGTEKSKGTKIFALTGHINNSGLIEVPMGITLREVIFTIGGGIPHGKKFKAVQTGGPSGGCIPEEYLDTPIDYEALARIGSIMGSGGMIVMDESSCMVDVAKYFMEFCMAESCGKCIPCRVGTAQMSDLLCKICDGDGTLEDLTLLEKLCDTVKYTSLCGLGQAAPNPVLSTLRYFRHEYLAHITDKQCPAGVCKIHKIHQPASQLEEVLS